MISASGGTTATLFLFPKLVRTLLLAAIASTVLVRCVRAMDAINNTTTTVIAITLPQTGVFISSNSENNAPGYFQPYNAVQSAMRLAADDVNTLGTVMEGNLSLAMLEVDTAMSAVERLCNIMEELGETGAFGVLGPLVSAQASRLEAISNAFLGLPLVSFSASTARAASYSEGAVGGPTGGSSYMFSVDPDIFDQMDALARLILDMKRLRDEERGWYFRTERVYVLHTYNDYGSIAASAFARAVRKTTGVNVGSDAWGQVDSSIEIARLQALPWTLMDFRDPLGDLSAAKPNIIVLLVEGFDTLLVRNILEQAKEVGLVHEGIQWYLSGMAVTDSVFAVNETYRDTQLAYDSRGLMGMRTCPPTEGQGSQEVVDLASRWVKLDGEAYPGAGAGTLTPDGRLEPFLAFAYDAVFTLAHAIGSVQQTAAEWGGGMTSFVPDSCPYSGDGLWEPGNAIRTAALLFEFVGVTGLVRFMHGGAAVTSGAGTAGSGWRKVNGTTFCAYNLQAHSTLGGTFVPIKSWKPETMASNTGADGGFEDIGMFQKNQTFPSGASVYPFDRATLRGMDLKVVTEATVTPVVIVTGREKTYSDYGGITMLLMQALSDRLGFTYNVTVVDSSVSTRDMIGLIEDGEFDMAASATTITEAWSEVVSFSFPFYNTGLSFVYRSDVVTEVNYWKLLEPFEYSLWLAIVMVVALVPILLWVFDGAKNDQFARRRALRGGNRRQAVKGIALTTYATTALLLGQMSHEPETLEGFVLSTGWIFTSFIVSASFTAELASFLAAEKAESLSFGLEDLRTGAVPHSQVALRQGSAFQTFYEEEIMECFSVAECNSGSSMPIPCYSLEECFDMVQNGTAKATLEASVTANFRVAYDYCGLNVLPDTFNEQHYGLVLPKDTEFLEELEQALLGMKEDGSLKSITESYFDPSRCDYLASFDSASVDSQHLTLVDMGGVFLILGIFMAVSGGIWIFHKSPPAKLVLRSSERWESNRRAREGAAALFDRETSSSHIAPHTNNDHRDFGDDRDVRTNSWPVLRMMPRKARRSIRREVDDEGEEKQNEEADVLFTGKTSSPDVSSPQSDERDFGDDNDPRINSWPVIPMKSYQERLFTLREVAHEGEGKKPVEFTAPKMTRHPRRRHMNYSLGELS